MQPKVSIIVPCWGVEKYLDQCVESIVAQTLLDIEIILVDDCSPDRVPEMCDAWAKRDARIRVVHKVQNEGLGYSCNTGLEHATGKYVAFCDSDDWVDPEMYETMYNAAEQQNADVVYTGLKRVDSTGKIIGVLAHPKDLLIYESNDIKKNLILDMIASSPEKKEDHPIQVSAKVVLYRRETIESNGIRFVSEREIPSEDLFFNLDFLSHAAKAVSLPSRFYNYRITLGSITQSICSNRFDQGLMVLYRHLIKRCRDLNLGIESEIRVMRLLIGNTRFLVCNICNSDWQTCKKKREISQIAHHDIWDDIKKCYPISSMPLSHSLFLIAIIYNVYSLLFVFSYYRKH